jgi:translation initiation factor 5A
MAKDQKQVRELSEGSYVMMDGAPCKITHYSTAKPGKHGSAKARVEGVGVFDEQKRSLSQPVDAKIWVPIIERKQGQVLNVEDDELQVMDLETYETFRTRLEDDMSPEPDETIEYLEYDGQRTFSS